MVIEMGSSHKSPQKRHLQINFPYPDFVNASLTRNSLPHKPQRERDILNTSRRLWGRYFIQFSACHPNEIITSDYQIVTAALKKVTKSGA